MAGIKAITASEEFKSLVSSTKDKLVVALFVADYAPQCAQMKEVLEELAKNHSEGIVYATVEAEKTVEIATEHNIEAVPLVLLFLNGKKVDSVQGADPQLLVKKVKQFSNKLGTNVLNSLPIQGDSSATDLNKRLEQLINSAPVMVFMKGSPDAPRCGFSRQLMEIFRGINADFKSFDILTDEEVRQGLKEYSNWPTYPQVYANGKLVGGLDIIKELHNEGELKDALNIA